MDSLLDKLTDWLKEMLVGGIMDNLTSTFTTLNQKIGEVTAQVAQTPDQFQPTVFNLVRNLSENVIMPIAGIILTFIACYELIQLVIAHNNLANFETWIFFKWVFKTFVAVTLITNTFNITMAVFDVAQHVVSQSGALIAGSTAVDASTLATMQSTLEAMDVGPLFGVFLQSFVVKFLFQLLSILIWAIVYGRMIEIYLTIKLKKCRSVRTGKTYDTTLVMTAEDSGKHLNNKLISCGIGIDYGNIVVTKVGMHGLESDEEKENELDFVWVGNATNHASKYTDLAPGKTIFVSKSCYENLKSVDKYEWEKYARSKDGYTLRGYLLQNVYSLNAENLGKAYCPDEDVLREDNSIIESITELEKQYEVLIAREKDIAVKEADFIKERDQLQKTVQELSDRVDELSEDNENLSEQLNAVLSDYYDYLYKIIGSWHCSSSQYKEEFRKNSAWRYFIDEAYKIGAQKGISVDGVTDRYACGLMEIYMYYDEPEKAYNALLTMAKNNNYWINLRDDIVNWANKNNKLSTLIYAIEGRLDRYEIPLDKRQEFYGYTQKLRKIRGY